MIRLRVTKQKSKQLYLLMGGERGAQGEEHGLLAMSGRERVNLKSVQVYNIGSGGGG